MIKPIIVYSGVYPFLDRSNTTPETIKLYI